MHTRNIGEYTMNEYVICERTKRISNRLNLLIYPSENTKYKLEVYANNGRFISYIGFNDEVDYAYLLEMVKIKLISMKYANHLREKWYERNLDNIYHNRFFSLEWKLLWR
jgi:hypothetical protein